MCTRPPPFLGWITAKLTAANIAVLGVGIGIGRDVVGEADVSSSTTSTGSTTGGVAARARAWDLTLSPSTRRERGWVVLLDGNGGSRLAVF